MIIQLRSIGRAQPEDLAAASGKLEGSIVNWINAPIFQLLGERSGFGVTVEPFAYREGSNISLRSARHRDAYRRPSGDRDDHELATEARDAGFGAVVA